MKERNLRLLIAILTIAIVVALLPIVIVVFGLLVVAALFVETYKFVKEVWNE